MAIKIKSGIHTWVLPRPQQPKIFVFYSYSFSVAYNPSESPFSQPAFDLILITVYGFIPSLSHSIEASPIYTVSAN